MDLGCVKQKRNYLKGHWVAHRNSKELGRWDYLPQPEDTPGTAHWEDTAGLWMGNLVC